MTGPSCQVISRARGGRLLGHLSSRGRYAASHHLLRCGIEIAPFPGSAAALATFPILAQLRPHYGPLGAWQALRWGFRTGVAKRGQWFFCHIANHQIFSDVEAVEL